MWRNVETGEFILEKCRNRGVYHALGEGIKTSIMLSQQVSSILHPSPASPAANKGWSGIVRRQLHDLGLLELIQNG